MSVVAIAQLNTESKKAESRPDNCRYQYGEYTCNFNGANNVADRGNTVMSVYPASIQRTSQGTVDFQYITSSTSVKRSAPVNCRGSLDHWHLFSDGSDSERVPVSTYTTHPMLCRVGYQRLHPLNCSCSI